MDNEEMEPVFAGAVIESTHSLTTLSSSPTFSLFDSTIRHNNYGTTITNAGRSTVKGTVSSTHDSSTYIPIYCLLL